MPHYMDTIKDRYHDADEMQPGLSCAVAIGAIQATMEMQATPIKKLHRIQKILDALAEYKEGVTE